MFLLILNIFNLDFVQRGDSPASAMNKMAQQHQDWLGHSS